MIIRLCKNKRRDTESLAGGWGHELDLQSVMESRSWRHWGGKSGVCHQGHCVSCSTTRGLESGCLQGGEHLASFSKTLRWYTDLTQACVLYLAISALLFRIQILSSVQGGLWVNLTVFLNLSTPLCNEEKKNGKTFKYNALAKLNVLNIHLLYSVVNQNLFRCLKIFFWKLLLY